MRILVVEDDPGVRSTVVRMLQCLGHTVAAVATGDEADRLPDDQPFEAVLADLRLPGLPGHRVIGRLRERWPLLKAVIMSGYTDHEEVRAGVLDGRWRLLPKPFDFEQLISQLRDPSEPAISKDT
ncbi:MAG: response regulator [Thermoanaerobaculaceae bacterium]|jgi:DNA-binding NtrC family response regulator